MKTHTPGPWVVVPLTLGSVESANGTPIAQAQQCAPREADLKHMERMANARLIASAPELLEALIDCRRALEIANFTQELAVVDAAISKATRSAT